MTCLPVLRIVLVSGLFMGCGGPQAGDALAQQPGAATNAPAATVCKVVETGRVLPGEVRETSGLARSTRNPEMFWTHNDAGNAAEIFALGTDGRMIQRVSVAGAKLVDWEDVESGRCGDGNCLYVGDIGDNDGARASITVYRFAEPAADAKQTETATALHMRFPDGPRDAEALFTDKAGTLHIVTKGREGAISLYRYPGAQRADQTVTLEHVRELFAQPADERDRVTSATATPDGRWIGVRTYRNLYVYAADELLSGRDVRPAVVDLSGLSETQGESIVLADDGSAWLTSEAANKKAKPTMSRMQCAFPGSSSTMI